MCVCVLDKGCGCFVRGMPSSWIRDGLNLEGDLLLSNRLFSKSKFANCCFLSVFIMEATSHEGVSELKQTLASGLWILHFISIFSGAAIQCAGSPGTIYSGSEFICSRISDLSRTYKALSKRSSLIGSAVMRVAGCVLLLLAAVAAVLATKDHLFGTHEGECVCITLFCFCVSYVIFAYSTKCKCMYDCFSVSSVQYSAQ